MTEVVISLLGGGLLAAAGAIWALVMRAQLVAARAQVAELRGINTRAMDAAEVAANALRDAERAAEGEHERIERAGRLKTDRIIALEEENAKLMRILAAVDPAAAALAAGDVLDGVLQAPPGRAAAGGDAALQPAAAASATNAGAGH